jgi:hypothetical protein
MNNSIFPILSFNDSSHEPIYSGTGFFINKGGIMISAGHVIKDEKIEHFALIDAIKYPIELIHKEYVEYTQQKEPIYLDLFIGKIGFDLRKIKPLTFSNEVMEDLQYIARGYSSKPLSNDEQSFISLDELNLEEFPPVLKYFEFPFLCSNLKMIREFEMNKQYFKNGFAVKMDGVLPFGLSGGPVMFKDSVKGIVILQNNCISSEYITSRLKKCKINFLLME